MVVAEEKGDTKENRDGTDNDAATQKKNAAKPKSKPKPKPKPRGKQNCVIHGKEIIPEDLKRHVDEVSIT